MPYARDYDFVSSWLFSEEVKFTKQPEACPAVEGQQLVLECAASGVPQPKFLWFKEREPLPSQTSNRYMYMYIEVMHPRQFPSSVIESKRKYTEVAAILRGKNVQWISFLG